jgi:hypothetical protein
MLTSLLAIIGFIYLSSIIIDLLIHKFTLASGFFAAQNKILCVYYTYKELFVVLLKIFKKNKPVEQSVG